MKVVIYSPAFSPQIGGLEEIAKICAYQLHNRGHQVTVLCETANNPPLDMPFKVYRNSGSRQLLKATIGCDVFLMFNISLKAIYLPLIARKPLVIIHQGWYGSTPIDLNWRARLKILSSRCLAINAACSNAIATYLGGNTKVIPNAYNSQIFFQRNHVQRIHDLLFVGRLVSDKGGALLLSAMQKLKEKEITPSLTFIGSGPEEMHLQNDAKKMGLHDRVRFLGVQRGEALAKLMNAHRILVVPSTWAEPFGIVALEGMASGCLVVGSKEGGLAEAIGPGGITFTNGCVKSLSHALERALQMESYTAQNKKLIEEHLHRHSAEAVGSAYETLLLNAIC